MIDGLGERKQKHKRGHINNPGYAGFDKKLRPAARDASAKNTNTPVKQHVVQG